MSGGVFEKLSSVDAEQAILGAMILKPEIIGWLQCSESHFAVPVHAYVYRAIIALYEADKPIDEVTLGEACKDAPGGLSVLSRLAIATPTADNVEHWVAIAEEYRRKRLLAELSSRTIEKLRKNEESSSDLHDSILEGLSGFAIESDATQNMAEVTGAEIDRLERVWAGEESIRYLTGIRRLDEYVSGLPVGTPTAIGAHPGTGKSMLLWNICFNAAKRGDHVLVLSNEDKPGVSARLALAYHSGIERERINSANITEAEKDRIREVAEEISEINERYHTVRVHGKSMREICREATGFIRRYGVKLVAIDYIQNVPNPKNAANRNLGIEENLTVFETMVADENITGIIISQLKRIPDDRRPKKSDFKDSGSIEQKSKMMLVLSPGQNDDLLEVDVVKNSEGKADYMFELTVDKGIGHIE